MLTPPLLPKTLIYPITITMAEPEFSQMQPKAPLDLRAPFRNFPPSPDSAKRSLPAPRAHPHSPGPTAGSHKSHRRSQSDTPSFAGLPPLPHQPSPNLPADVSADDLFAAYMSLQTLDLDAMNPPEAKSRDLDSDNEAESSANAPRHYRSVSMDSFMGSMCFGEDPVLGPSPHSRSAFEFGSGEFSDAEVKKIMANEKLSEIAVADPKRAKRILANRQSAARSKERKMRYISELEHKVQTLQTEATTLLAQLTLLQRDSTALTNQNNELKFRLQAMEQQAHLRDALNEALTAEVQRLKLVAGESQLVNSLNQQMQLNSHMFQMQTVEKQQQQQQQQQSSQIARLQMQSQQQSQQQQPKNTDASRNDINK